MIGSTIGPYEILAKLGEGGMGAVPVLNHPHIARIGLESQAGNDYIVMEFVAGQTLAALLCARQPLFRLLGSPEADKKHALYEGGHFPPINGIHGASLAWFDKYLGPADGAR